MELQTSTLHTLKEGEEDHSLRHDVEATSVVRWFLILCIFVGATLS